MKKISSVLFSALVLVSCASKPENIDALYVSPTRYASLTCDQLNEEFREVQSRVNAMTKKQRKQRKNDKIATGVGLVVFWPALFFLMSDDQKEELAMLKGEYEALKAVHQRKDCLGEAFSDDSNQVAADEDAVSADEPLAQVENTTIDDNSIQADGSVNTVLEATQDSSGGESQIAPPTSGN